MELMTLGTRHQPARLVENYDSLIWSERFNVPGDFQITTGAIDYFMDMLPEGCLVGIRESPVPMIVETHQIKRAKNQPEVLTIKGRSVDSILDRRIAVQSTDPNPGEWKVVVKQPSDVAWYIIKQIVVDGVLTPSDKFDDDNIIFLEPDDYLTGTGPNREYVVPRGNLLTAVSQFLQAEVRADPTTVPPTPKVHPHGIRAVRPNPAGDKISVEIYTGTDRTEQVYFDARRDQLDDGTYLFSKVGSADIAYILGSSSTTIVRREGDPSGLARRVVLVDGTSSNATTQEGLEEIGRITLSQAKPTALFDGSLNEDISSYTYGVDYELGDIVQLVGDYGLAEKARVTEFIRTEDATGSRAFPTLSTITED